MDKICNVGDNKLDTAEEYLWSRRHSDKTIQNREHKGKRKKKKLTKSLSKQLSMPLIRYPAFPCFLVLICVCVCMLYWIWLYTILLHTYIHSCTVSTIMEVRNYSISTKASGLLPQPLHIASLSSVTQVTINLFPISRIMSFQVE